ncbi:hypothetical protein ACHWQZ_G004422 [Mnemiopsis leidyi]
MNLIMDKNLLVILLSFQLVPSVCRVDEKVRNNILHARSYAEAFKMYEEAFEPSDARVWSGALHFNPQIKKEIDNKRKRKQQKFIKNVRQCNKHNKNFHEGITGYTQTVNMFSTMEEEEMKMYTGLNISEAMFDDTMRVKRQEEPLQSDIPESINWVQKGYVTKVKAQLQCGSCWTFSSIVPLEYAYKKITGNLVPLSEQVFLDCVTPDVFGCRAGFPPKCYRYVTQTGFIATAESYPYKAQVLPCRIDSHPNAMAGKFELSGFGKVKGGDDPVQAVMSAVVNYGPVVAACYIANDFHAYDQGIFDGSHIFKGPNHAMAIVGYDENAWLVKNSWGEDWGMDGYVHMKRRNIGGLLEYAYYITVEKVEGYNPLEDKDGSCRDEGSESDNVHCSYWKSLGHCESKKWYMAKICAATCQLCDGSVTETEEDEEDQANKDKGTDKGPRRGRGRRRNRAE